jgi:hypothetical protein
MVLNKIRAINERNHFTSETMMRMATRANENTHFVYILYSTGWEKILDECTEDKIEETVAKHFAKGCYKLYVREKTDARRENVKVFTK